MDTHKPPQASKCPHLKKLKTSHRESTICMEVQLKVVTAILLSLLIASHRILHLKARSEHNQSKNTI